MQILLTTAQAAELLNLSRRTLEDWRLRGGGPSYVVLGREKGRRGRVRYRREALLEYVAAHEQSCQPPEDDH